MKYLKRALKKVPKGGCTCKDFINLKRFFICRAQHIKKKKNQLHRIVCSNILSTGHHSHEDYLPTLNLLKTLKWLIQTPP